MTLILPKPRIKRRPVDTQKLNQALQEGFPPLLSHILAARPTIDALTVSAFLDPRLKMLTSPDSLADIDKAAQRIIKALKDGEYIGIETDHDCDGQTSHAVLYTALTQYFKHPKEKIASYIGHRLAEGYGLSEGLMDRILADSPRPTLIITADNGSSDEKQIARLKSEGIDTIVTDHHEIPLDGIPQSAHSVINPVREDSKYPDRYIAGCMVAWLLMAYTRSKLMQTNHEAIPSLAELLDFVAVGTIADCVSMARSLNNRIVVSYGMKRIEAGLRPCWRALLPQLSLPLSSDDLGFKIGPMLNSDGRLSSALGSVSFLLAIDEDEAQKWVSHLHTQNLTRKDIQDKITKMATIKALEQTQQGQMGICILLEEGHAGVHGITASRVKDLFGLPTIIFSPKQDSLELITGSARSVDGFHMKKALEQIALTDKQIMDKFGGHAGAAGVTLHRDRFEQFAVAFNTICHQALSQDMIGPVVWTDIEIDEASFLLSEMDDLVSRLEPFGREFSPPVFEAQGTIMHFQSVGQTGKHLKLRLKLTQRLIELIWFNCMEAGENPPVQVGQGVLVAFTPKLQTFRNQRQMSCQVLHLEPLDVLK